MAVGCRFNHGFGVVENGGFGRRDAVEIALWRAAWTGRLVATLDPAAGKCSRLFSRQIVRAHALLACIQGGIEDTLGALSQNMELSARTGSSTHRLFHRACRCD